MTTITIDVPDELFRALGEKGFQAYLEKQYKDFRLIELAGRIKTAIEAGGVMLDEEIETAQRQAWQEHKAMYLKDNNS